MPIEQDGNKRPKVGLRAKLLLVLIGLLFGLVVMEIALRVIGYSYPIFYTTDPDRGYALRPGVAGWYRREGGSFVRINSDGLRDREHAKAKPPNTFRIVLLGDSFSEAMHVPMEETYWSLMERRLKECPEFAGKDVEVINFGVSGYGTAQELITLRRRAWDYQPDMVILAMTTFNDITDNSPALKKTEEIPYFVYRDGQLVLDDSFLTSPTYRRLNSGWNRLGRWIRDNSRVIQAIHHAQFVFKTYMEARRAQQALEQQRAEAQKAKSQNQQPQSEPSQGEQSQPKPQNVLIDHLIYREPRDPVWVDAWNVTEALIRTMRDEVREHGAECLVVTVSNDVQALPNPKSRENFLRSVGGDDLFYPDRRIKSLGEREGFEVLNLAPLLQAYAEENNLYLHGFGRDLGNGHWNSAGHREAAEIITRRVCEMKVAGRLEDR